MSAAASRRSTTRTRGAALRPSCAAIDDGVERLPIGERCRLMCEPGRALVAEAESLIVRVDARRGNELFINDGSYGTLFDAAHMGFNFPVRLLGPQERVGRAADALLVLGPAPATPSTSCRARSICRPRSGRRLHRDRQHRRLRPRHRRALQRLRRLRRGDPARCADADHVSRRCRSGSEGQPGGAAGQA